VTTLGERGVRGGPPSNFVPHDYHRIDGLRNVGRVKNRKGKEVWGDFHLHVKWGSWGPGLSKAIWGKGWNCYGGGVVGKRKGDLSSPKREKKKRGRLS